MPVPNSIAELSPTIALNSPPGTESAKGTIDDYLRSHGAFIRQLSDQLLGPTVTLASASTVAIGFAASANIAITGTTAIAAFDVASEGTMRYVTFGGALTLGYNATSMQLPGAANIVTVAGDVALFKSLGGGNWKCMGYWRMSGTGPVAASATRDGYLSLADWTTFNAKQATGVCLPLAGGTMSGNIVNANNTGYYAKDAGGTARQIFTFASDNTVNLTVAGGSTINTYNQAGSTVLHSLDNVGNVNITGSLMTVNGGGLSSKDAGGTLRPLVYMAGNSVVNRVAGGTSILWYNQAGSTALASLDNTGNFSAVTVAQTSDERKKENWRPLTDAQLDALANMTKAGLFDWIDGGESCGGSAQEIRAIVPQAVYEADDEHRSLTVNYGGLCFAIQQATLRRLWGAK